MKRSKIKKYQELTGNKEHLATIEPIAVKPEQ